MHPSLSLVDPRELLAPHRLDLVVKHRMFRHLIDGDDPEAEALYRWHIRRRTGGREPGGTKLCLGDYTAACRDLLASMQAVGFLSYYPVRVGRNGRLTAGAHRIACALALDMDVWRRGVPRPGRAADWGAAWFLARGMDAAKVAELEAEWERLRRA